MLANARSVLGALDDVGVVKLVGFVNSSPDFADQPAVVNGASDLLVDVFGAERGRHARSAVGVNALPLGAAIEIEAVFEVG
jgi:enamine deaminase RidA (YjgF/YER057c/UK114 family)